MIDIKPTLSSIGKTEQLLDNQGYSYNEDGKSYNELLMTYGGIYGRDYDNPPIFSVERIERVITNNWTFNQAGISFNESTKTFNGFTGNDSIAPVWG
jgi:hypothetical protein